MLLEQGTYKLSEEVLAVGTSGEDVLMDYGSGKYFGIRGAARMLLEPLRDGQSFEQMVDLVSRHFAIPASVAEADLRTVLPKLLEAGLVRQTEQS